MFDLGGVLLSAHIIFGTIAVLSGAIALSVKKGGTTHINVGRVFVVVMGLSSAIGAILGLLKLESFYITFHAGILGLTLILSGWLTVRTPQMGPLSIVVGVINFLNAGALIIAGSYALSLTDAVLFGFHAEDYFYLSGMASIGVICDITLIFRKPLSQRHRIARHLWRMCFGFFIAAGSAFTGPGAVIFPQAIQDSGILSAPEIIIMLLMLFWLSRTLLSHSPSKKATRYDGI